MTKVFGIGFHKTGTTTLHLALTRLGFSVVGHSPHLLDSLLVGDLEPAMAIAAQADATEDNPWPLLYQELDERFPQSRFVLTIRPTDVWLRSVQKHFAGTTTPMRRWIYGDADPIVQPEKFVTVFENHNAAVHRHFAGRPHQLLEVDWASGNGWDPLCDFLGLSAPSERFPHANQARFRRLRELRKFTKNAFTGRLPN